MERNVRQITIVLAEDDPDDQVLVREAFLEAQMVADLHIVNDGLELLEHLRGKGPRPDLILLDLNMPRMSGHEALAEIKNDPELRSIPVIVLTTSKAEEDVVATYDSGANSFITKPVTFPGLVDAMATLEKYWLRLVEIPPNA